MRFTIFLVGLGLALTGVVAASQTDPSKPSAIQVGKESLPQTHGTLAADLATLQEAKVDCQGPALLNFLAQRTPTQHDQKRLQKLIDDLGHKTYAVREKATKALIEEAGPALPFLTLAVDDANSEIVTRAKLCIKTINIEPSPEVPAAVIRMLALASDQQKTQPLSPLSPLSPINPISPKDDPRDLKPAAVIPTLLAYLPFAVDETVEEEIVNALVVLCKRDTKIDPALLAALKDPLPARRSAAAVVLGKAGGQVQVQAIRILLSDAVPKVRFRAVQGLLASLDKSTVPVLIDLLALAPERWLWQVEDQLAHLAAGNPPSIPAWQNTSDYRKKAAAAWLSWWKANEQSLDLAAVNRGAATLGVYVITEYDTLQRGAFQQHGRVWECGRDGKPRWEIANVQGAFDSHVLPSGRVLVAEAENTTQRITERDQLGKVTWIFNTPGPPIAVQRLANGNTFLCTHDRVMEVTPAGKTVYNCSKSPQHFMYGACRLKNGHVAAITAEGLVLIFDPATNRDLKTIPVGNPGGWSGIDALPNGRFLIATQPVGQIREIDATGKIHWQINFPGVRAVKLPNGNVLACSMTTRRVAELDRTGAEVWGVTCKGRPWSVKYR